MIFPDCTFRVLLPHGVMWTGTRVDGTLEVVVPETIPRAEHLDLRYTVSAWAGYGSGKNRSVVNRTMFHAPLEVALPDRTLPAGTHRYPFRIDVPDWLPPPYSGNDCGVEHVIDTHLEVAWAIDPKLVLNPAVVMAPRQAVRTPFTARTPPGFHESIVLEATLASSTIAKDEPLGGQIALRGGHDARFDAVTLTLMDVTTLRIGRGDTRHAERTVVRIPAAALRGGAPVPFTFPPDPRISPTFRNAFLENDVALLIAVDIPWSSDPVYRVPLMVLPAGSTMHGEASYAPVGSARLRLSAAAMASQTGFEVGREPVLVEGSVPPVSVRITDAAREGALGLDLELVFPDLGLGTSFHKRGLLDGFRESPLLARPLADEYVLRAKPDDLAPPVDEAALAAFYAVALGGLETATELRVSDHHVACHFALADDDGKRMTDFALFAKQKASAIGAAIARLPFPSALASSRSAWQAVASEESGILVPTGPSLHGLTFGAQLFDGSERTIGVAIRTVWRTADPETHVDIALRTATVPDAAASDFAGDGLTGEKGGELARAVRETFGTVDVHGGNATLSRAGFTPDPRTLFPAIEAFLSWLLEVRKERRATAPYR